jgi:hypothetical protein
MANYKFDGRNLKQGSTTIANVSGNNIRKGSGSSVLCNVSGDKIRQGSGSSVLCNVSGDKIRQGSGSSTIAKMSDVRRAIDGPGGVTLAALWFTCVR